MKPVNIKRADVNKTLENLYELSDKIREFKYEQDMETYASYIWGAEGLYTNVVFQTKYCGEPKVYSSLNIPVVASQLIANSELSGGVTLYSCNYVVNCRLLPDIFDLDGRQIYEGSNKILFVYRYSPATVGHVIDEALFAPPRIEFEESKDNLFMYNKASEILVNQINSPFDLKDELTRLSLVNRITELQMQAYLQGRSCLEELKKSRSIEES